jgi:hypothetical protein
MIFKFSKLQKRANYPATRKFLFVLFLLIVIPVEAVLPQSDTKNRVIILTDIEADPDDSQSLVRLLLYSNQIEIK